MSVPGHPSWGIAHSSRDMDIEIKKIRNDLDILVMLYKKLVEKMIPIEEPSEEEKIAIKSKDEILGREEIAKALE